MIHTRICDLLGIDHPIVLGGMGSATTATLVAAVSNAGSLGTLGTSAFNAATLKNEIAAIHERTDKPFGINHLLFQTQEDMFAVTLSARPAVIAFAWARKEQNLHDYIQRAHYPSAKTPA
jgi:NAD(P)H-dependent flavin oxidoreductase YrpB (nitropropane dioxygenase family)